MIKAMAFLRRKPGMTMEQFIEYYETRHVPLVRRLSPTLGEYKRYYLDHGAYSYVQAPETSEDGRQVPFDVVTEVNFATQEDFDTWVRNGEDPELQRLLAEDEINFLDRKHLKIVVVHEYPKT